MNTRADIRREYKEKDSGKEMGIVAIKNKRNGRMWLKSTFTPESILRRHRFDLSLGSSRMKGLQGDWNEFGEEAFSFEILDTVKPDPLKDKAAELVELEALWREKLATELANEYK